MIMRTRTPSPIPTSISSRRWHPSIGVAVQNARLFAEIQRQKQLSEALVQTSPVAIVTSDQRNRVTSWNPAAERLFGYRAEEAVGESLDGLITDPEMPELCDRGSAVHKPGPGGR